MKINKKEWHKMCDKMTKYDAVNQQINPLPDVQLGDEIYKPKVNHPEHYNTGKYETIDVIEDWNLDFHCGNTIKYISRHKHTGNPKQDIEKAIWYLQRYLETLNENS